MCQKDDDFVVFWLCKQCPAVRRMCDECYKARSGKPNIRCDKEHKFFQIGGEEWAKMPEGQTNSEGMETRQFIRVLKEKWGNFYENFTSRGYFEFTDTAYNLRSGSVEDMSSPLLVLYTFADNL